MGYGVETMTQATRADRLTYTVAESADLLGMSERTLYRRIKEGKLRAYHWVGRTLIRAEDLQAALDEAAGKKKGR
jgi:excisionase family DNA binding protein